MLGAGLSRRPVASRDEYLERWSRLHGDVDPARSRLVGGWLRLVYALARPLARAGVVPDAVTLGGLVAAGLVAWLAALGGPWFAVAALVVVLSGLLDGLDGAVALLTDRATRFGFVLDSLVDRVADLLYLLALWLAGAPAGVCVAAGAVTLLHEYTRARAAAGGLPDVGVVTVAERPTRVVITTAFLLAAASYPAAAEEWARAGAVAWLAVSVVGLTQLLVVVRRRLR